MALDRGRVYELNGADSQSLTALGAFGVVPDRISISTRAQDRFRPGAWTASSKSPLRCWKCSGEPHSRQLEPAGRVAAADGRAAVGSVTVNMHTDPG